MGEYMYIGKLAMKEYFEKKYFLRDNPFSITPSPKEIVWADRKELLKRLMQTIDTSISTSPSRIIINWGLWGGGKTHAMVYFTSEYFKEEMQKKYGPRLNFVPVGIHLPRPIESGSMARLLYYELINAISIKTIQDAIIRINKHIQDKGFEPFKAAEKLQAHLNTLTKREEYAKMLVRLAKATISSLERKFLYGEKLASKDIRELRITRGIESIGDMLEIFGLITDILTQPFDDLPEMMAEIFIWIDENEALRDLSPKDVFIYRSFLRDLFDYAPKELTIFLNFSLSTGQDFSTVEAQLGDALISRVDEQIHFTPIRSLEECLEYVRKLIEHVRIGKVQDPFYPFTEDSVRFIVSQQIDEGLLPRDLNKIFRKTLELGYSKGVNRLDHKFIENNKALIFPKQA